MVGHVVDQMVESSLIAYFTRLIQFPMKPKTKSNKIRILTIFPDSTRGKLIVFASVIVLLPLFYSVFAKVQNPWRAIQMVTPNAVFDFKVEVAKTEFEKQRGLMFRKSLAENKGMLFVYDKPSFVSFWMKNTLIPLDILFIGSDLKIKSISENTPPCPPATVCPSYPSLEPVQYVLELNGGTTARQKIGLGDNVDLLNSITDPNSGLNRG